MGKRYLFMTTGTGEGTEKGMMVSIICLKPQKVIFLSSKKVMN